MRRVAMLVGLVVVVAIVVSGCGGASATTAAPTQAPTETASAPASTPTSPPPPPTVAATEPPTEAPPAVEPSPTTPSERVSFNWAPGSVPPSDADDVAIIADELRENDGILGADGGETVINVFFNPTVISVEEIMEILRGIGHPVVINE